MGRVLIDVDRYPPASRGLVVVWGLLSAYPFGGMTWQVIHYIVGLRRLGFDVWYVEDSDRYLYRPEDFGRTSDATKNAAYLNEWMERIGMADRWVLREPHKGQSCLGALDFDGLLALYRASDAVLNLCGAQEPLPYHAEASCRVYVQTDPVADQVSAANGDADKISELQSYQHLFTYGTNLGEADCLIPEDGFTWLKTLPPVCLDLWETDQPPSRPTRLTTIAKWRHSSKDVNWAGANWRWSKHATFRPFLDLPRRSPLALEMAVSSIKDEERRSLEEKGWMTRTTSSLADPTRYRTYIQGSLGEFSVAKEQYVAPLSGWFSDRSVCYLAAGRPVVVQETGFSKVLPTGAGLLGYSNADEAIRALRSVADDYDRHATGARRIAHDIFDAQRVLADMLGKIGLA